MKHTLIIAVFVVMLLVVFAATSIHRWQTVETTEFTDLRPGDVVPQTVSCHIPGYFAANGALIEYCTSYTPDNLMLYITTDLRTHTIQRISVWVFGKVTVGDLVQRYGQPIGAEYKRNGYSRSIYWRDFSAFVVTKNDLWTPNSNVYFIAYRDSSQESPYEKWQGFKVK